MTGTPDPMDALARRDIAWPRVLLALLVVGTAVSLIAVAAMSASAFGLYNPAWDGSTEFRQAVADDPDTDLVLARETDVYAEYVPSETIAFVTAPSEAYEGTDADRLRRFVADGGTLVVLENVGSAGNDLLARVGADTRVDGRLLRDEHRYDLGPAMPIATGVNASTVDPSVERLALNHATAVNASDDATVLVRTSPYAYLGSEETDLADADLGRHPVAAAEPVGNGTVLTIGDPSVTINAMFDRSDNAAFLASLYEGTDHVIVDVSHADELPPLRATLLTVRGSPGIGAALGLAGLAVIAGARSQWYQRIVGRARARARRGSARPAALDEELADSDALAAVLRGRHPEWDRDRIRRVTRVFNTNKNECKSNE